MHLKFKLFRHVQKHHNCIIFYHMSIIELRGVVDQLSEPLPQQLTSLLICCQVQD